MSPLAHLIREEIARRGPITFERFMELALYHTRYGYYCRGRDPFGREGNYYTAAQLQPVFGLLMAACVRALYEEMGGPRDFLVVDLGAGRGEMALAFFEWTYRRVELGGGAVPERFRGVVFANEFFDALPVRAAVGRGGAYRELRVAWNGERFVWWEGEEVRGEAADYLRRFAGDPEEGRVAEANLQALHWLEEIAARLERGFLLVMDYGYTARESGRFPAGTLMSYRRHAALEDVLVEPGERDITAHVCFTALEEHGARCGFRLLRRETLARTLLRAGEPDAFAAALEAPTEPERLRRRLQLKTLLAGMGETFSTLLLEKEPRRPSDPAGAGPATGKRKRPRPRGA